MPRKTLPRVNPGDAVTAAIINSASEALEQQRILPGAGVKVADTGQGVAISVDGIVGFWAKVGAVSTSGAAPAYAWTEQITQDGGTWVDGPRAGTTTDNPARESTANATVASGTIAWFRQAPGSEQLVFTASKCP